MLIPIKRDNITSKWRIQLKTRKKENRGNYEEKVSSHTQLFATKQLWRYDYGGNLWRRRRHHWWYQDRESFLNSGRF